jgi:hypothetical protein
MWVDKDKIVWEITRMELVRLFQADGMAVVQIEAQEMALQVEAHQTFELVETPWQIES